MTTDELARMLREIEIKEFNDGDTDEYSEYDNLDEALKEMYMKVAKTYQKYFDMERKT